MRGYAVQHIAMWIEKGKLDSGDRERLLGAVRTAAAEVDKPSVGGAGLIAFRAVGDGGEAGALAMKALCSKNACAESRISAFQVCAELGVSAALEPARAAVADASAPTILRMSAIAALARLGGADDERLLRSLIASGQKENGSGDLFGKNTERHLLAFKIDNDQDELVRNAARFALASRTSEGK